MNEPLRFFFPGNSLATGILRQVCFRLKTVWCALSRPLGLVKGTAKKGNKTRQLKKSLHLLFLWFQTQKHGNEERIRWQPWDLEMRSETGICFISVKAEHLITWYRHVTTYYPSCDQDMSLGSRVSGVPDDNNNDDNTTNDTDMTP